MTLRRRLVVAFAYLLVLTVVALAIPLGISVDRRAKDAFYNRLSTQAQEIASSLGGSAIPGGTRQHLSNVVAEDGGQTDARVIVTDGSDQARLLADSDDNDARPPRVAYNTRRATRDRGGARRPLGAPDPAQRRPGRRPARRGLPRARRPARGGDCAPLPAHGGGRRKGAAELGGDRRRRGGGRDRRPGRRMGPRDVARTAAALARGHGRAARRRATSRPAPRPRGRPTSPRSPSS